MGKGDKKSKKGKRQKSSFGVSRNRKAIKARLTRSATKKTKVSVEPVAAKPKRVVKKKAEG